jgi:hypothetical protein
MKLQLPFSPPKKTKKKIILRNIKGQFTGCGNPSGRPNGAKSVNDSLSQMLESDHIDIFITRTDAKGKSYKMRLCLDTANKQDFKAAIAATLIQEALKGNIKAIQEIYDRTEGKPTQKIIGAMEGLEVVIDEDE